MLNPAFQVQLSLLAKLFKEKNIKSAYAFGSVVSDKFNDDSDIDLLINFEDGIGPLEKGRFAGFCTTRCGMFLTGMLIFN